jgi:hypothetical protein
MTQNLADELEAPKPGTPLPWQYRDDYTSEGFVTIIGNIDGEYVDGRADCTYDVVCRCEDEFGERLPNVAQNVRYIVHACNEYPALVRELDALKAENERLREALVQHNDRLRSACAIADRDGKDTNWLSFRGQCHYTLAEYHELVNEARQALGEQP